MDGVAPGNISATADLPTGTFALAGDLVQSTATVPEPESWALMILGFGVAGMALRRRGAPALAAA